MNQGKYKGAGIGYARMNRIIRLMMEGLETADEMVPRVGLEKKRVLTYLNQIVEDGLATFTQDRSNSPRVFTLTAAGTFYDIPEPVWGKRPSRATGKKPGRPKRDDRPKANMIGDTRKIITIPARNEGMKRDQLVAALFGEAA